MEEEGRVRGGENERGREGREGVRDSGNGEREGEVYRYKKREQS